MKTNQRPGSWSLCSVINTDGRRVIRLWRNSVLKRSQLRLVQTRPIAHMKGDSKPEHPDTASGVTAEAP